MFQSDLKLGSEPANTQRRPSQPFQTRLGILIIQLVLTNSNNSNSSNDSNDSNNSTNNKNAA